jgi:Rho GTPase-activating protein RGD1
VRDAPSPELTAVLDMMTSYQIVLQERRAVSVNATADAAAAVGAHSRAQFLATSATPSGRRSTQSPPPSRSSSPPPPRAPGSHSLSTTPPIAPGGVDRHNTTNAARRPSSSASATRRLSHSGSAGVDGHGNVAPCAMYVFSGQDQADHVYEHDDYNYALNLHMGTLGEVFGQPLDNASHTVPAVVVDCLLLLEHNGLKTEGIFRISGDDAAIMDLRRSYDEGLDNFSWRSDLSLKEADVHNAASLLKLYFRTLPDPLIPRKCYRPLCESLKLPKDEFIVKAKAVIHPPDVSPLNVRIIAHLFRLLYLLTENSQYNKMTKENIAIVFAPSLLLPEGAQELGLYELQNGIGIVRLLVENAVEIFEDAWEIHPLA